MSKKQSIKIIEQQLNELVNYRLITEDKLKDIQDSILKFDAQIYILENSLMLLQGKKKAMPVSIETSRDISVLGTDTIINIKGIEYENKNV